MCPLEVLILIDGPDSWDTTMFLCPLMIVCPRLKSARPLLVDRLKLPLVSSGISKSTLPLEVAKTNSPWGGKVTIPLIRPLEVVTVLELVRWI